MMVRKLKIRRGNQAFHSSIVPTTAGLTLTRYAPVITGSVAQLVTPTTRALTITEFVPFISATGNNPQSVTPTTKALTTTRYAPSVTGSGNQVVTPTTKALTVTRFAVVVTAGSHQLVTPVKKSLTITKHVPTVSTSAGSGPSYYMAPGGSDAAAGTIGAPWATIQKFINTNPSPGSTLYLRSGNYTQSDGGHTGEGVGDLIGTASQPITIKNYPGETPVSPTCRAKRSRSVAIPLRARSVRTTSCSMASGSPDAHRMMMLSSCSGTPATCPRRPTSSRTSRSETASSSWPLA